MSSDLTSEESAAPVLPVADDDPNAVRTRRGPVRVFSERIPRDRWRSWVIIEGYHEAVISYVAHRMHGCTECYEHMFTVRSIEKFGNHTLRIKCIDNLYAGD